MSTRTATTPAAATQRDYTVQTIKCNDIADFASIIAALVREGIAFKANGSDLLIQITGF